MFTRPTALGPVKKPGMMRTNQTQLGRHGLQPYYKTRDFRKKIAMLYVPALQKQITESKGRPPVFKISKTAFQNLKKPDTSSASSAHRPAKAK